MKIVESVNNLKMKYHTSDPFVLSEKLNIEIRYVDFMHNPQGQYNSILGKQIILISKDLEYSTDRFFVCAHELGHAVNHKELSSYYSLNNQTKSKSEYEANKFATLLLTEFYIEEVQYPPCRFKDLTIAYGLPEHCFHFLQHN